ncbi:putative Mg chelatase homolog [Nautilia profundicola AmH]|uniref:Mg chelatase homolog n=1 Tax=Nautilia profundicola (strain ATCC BAA-1463 / DSM 18972 / AmH) TaxID=598659 RepID=B9L6X0_NAUPA|nr:YifB family Mg chelatase-like AAA ATPase [Nautilia profundicola]ACM92407.1 putative Mg chelatase homolog [Nautilia profundicola AmH]
MEKTAKTKTKKINSATLEGFEAQKVEVESSFTKGLPGFAIVGLGSQAIQESKERIKSALLNNDFEFPPLKITINLAPADLPKSGSQLDLPIALSILYHKKNIDLSEYLVLGELGLDGSLKDTNSIFPIILSLKPKKVIIPLQSAEKVSKIPGVEVYAFSHIKEFEEFEPKKVENNDFNYSHIKIEGKKYYYLENFELDFKDVLGQNQAKEAALISAAGFHNILFEGSPGVGKSMIIGRMRYILPPMSLEEILEVEKYNSLEGKEVTFKPVRPFRSPHYSSTKAAIFGGGSRGAKIGEIAFANKGMLFFDELPHFQKDVLENLRLPLQDKKVLISRVNSKIEYETDILFAAAMNPCPCGNLLSTNKECRCTELEIKRYKNRISEPLYDRIEIYLQMTEDDSKDTVSSKEMFEKILTAFEIQKGEFNANLPENYKFDMKNGAYEILKKAIVNFGLSKRSEFNLLKVAKTVANINKRNKIQKEDLLKALQFRRR